VVLGLVSNITHEYRNPSDRHDSLRSVVTMLCEEVWKGSVDAGDSVRAVTPFGSFHGGRWMARGTPIQAGARILAWLNGTPTTGWDLAFAGWGLFSDSLLFTPEDRGVALSSYRKRMLEFERHEHQPYSTIVAGRVIRQDTRTPVRNAVVRVVSSGDSARTDRTGAYQLFVPRFGYQQLRVELPDRTSHDFESLFSDESIDSLEIAVRTGCH